jgi:hypothetical protein
MISRKGWSEGRRIGLISLLEGIREDAQVVRHKPKGAISALASHRLTVRKLSVNQP